MVVAVVAKTAPVVLRAAVDLAKDLGVGVVAVNVDTSRVVVARHPDGTVDSAPVDPDSYGDPDDPDREELRRLVASASVPGTAVTLVETVGNPAAEIARLAERLDARMIVVGTREPGLAHHVVEFFTGSVAVQLAHRQSRPLLVVPMSPGSFETSSPWEG